MPIARPAVAQEAPPATRLTAISFESREADLRWGLSGSCRGSSEIQRDMVCVVG